MRQPFFLCRLNPFGFRGVLVTAVFLYGILMSFSYAQVPQKQSDTVQTKPLSENVKKKEVVKHNNGWRTERVIEVIDGSVSIVESEYTDDNILAHKVEFLRADTGEETVDVYRYGANSVPVEIFALETSDGKFVEYANEQYGPLRHVMFDDDGKWYIKTSDNDGYSIYAQENNFRIVSHDVSAVTEIPLRVDDATGILDVPHKNPPIVISILPDDALRIAKESGLEDVDVDLRIVEHKGVIAYEASFERQVKLFGIIPLSLPGIMYIDASSGEVVDYPQETAMMRLIMKLSF